MYKNVKLIIAALVAGYATNASAANAPTITLGGSLDTQVGHQSQKSGFNSTAATAVPANSKYDTYGIVNDTKLKIKADGAAHGLKYGGLITLNTDTSDSKQRQSSVAYQTMMYVETAMGRLEAGSYTGAYDAMKVSGSTIARATGGIDGDWKYWVNTDVDGTFNVLTSAGLNILSYKPTLPTSFDKSHQANASKATYYTPTFGGFKAGVTYIPDTEQHGTVTNLKPLTKSHVAFSTTEYNQTHAFKNVFQGGISYKYKYNEVGFDFSALGEIGDAKKIFFGSTTIDRHDLRAYEVGAKMSYMGFAVAGSYGDWGKSGLAKTVSQFGAVRNVAGAKAGKYWTAGANYVNNCFGMSLGYLNAENGGFGGNLVGVATPSYSPLKGKASLYSFGVDYKLAPGFMPYAEITQFDLKDRTRANGAGKNSGTVILAGTKLQF